jgi:hypothetical protein
MEVTVASSYRQHVVVTPLAIARVERRSEDEVRQTSSIAFSVGGLVGPVLAAIAERVGMPGGPTRLYLLHSDPPALAEMADVFTCWAADVPPEITRLPRWPAVEGFRPVTFYPRAALASVRLSFFGGLSLDVGKAPSSRVKLPVPPWQHGRIRSALVGGGYPLAPPSP